MRKKKTDHFKYNIISLMIGCALITICVMTALGVFSHFNKKRIAVQNMEYLQDSTKQVASQLENWYEQSMQNMRIMSLCYAKEPDHEPGTTGVLQEWSKQSVFSFLYFADSKGNFEGKLGTVINVSEREYFQNAMKGNSGMEVVFDAKPSEETFLVLYAPVYEGRQIRGVLIGGISPKEQLAPLLDRNYYEENAVSYWCLPNGRIWASNRDIITTEETLVTDLFKEEPGTVTEIENFMKDGDSVAFAHKETDTVLALHWLSDNKGFLLQVFPDAAANAQMESANRTGKFLEVVMLAIFAMAVFCVGFFYVRELTDVNSETKKAENYTQAVLAGALAIFEGDLSENAMIADYWKPKGHTTKSLLGVLGLSFPCTYDDYMNRWAEKFVDPEDRELYLDRVNRNILMNAYNNSESEIFFDYKAVTSDGREIFVRQSIFMAEDRRSGNVVAHANLREITEQKEKDIRFDCYEQILLSMTSDSTKKIRLIELQDFNLAELVEDEKKLVTKNLGNLTRWLNGQDAIVHSEDLRKYVDFMSDWHLIKMSVGDSESLAYRGKDEQGEFRTYTVTINKIEIQNTEYAIAVTTDN